MFESSDIQNRLNESARHYWLKLSQKPPSMVFAADGGVWAKPEKSGDTWCLRFKTEALVMRITFPLVFGVFFGGFIGLVAGRTPGMSIGLFCALMTWLVILLLIHSTGFILQPVLESGNWIWHGNRFPLSPDTILFVKHAEAPYTTSRSLCLFALTPDGHIETLSYAMGTPIVHLLRMAGYTVWDTRFGMPTPWPEWA